jgi:hypothetical protein
LREREKRAVHRNGNLWCSEPVSIKGFVADVENIDRGASTPFAAKFRGKGSAKLRI